MQNTNDISSTSSSTTITIFHTFHRNKFFQIEIQNEDSVKEIKEKISSFLKINISNDYFYLNKRKLSDDELFQNLNYQVTDKFMIVKNFVLKQM